MNEKTEAEEQEERYYNQPELEEAALLISEEKYQEAMELAKPFMGSDNEKTSCEAKHIVGLSNFHLGNFQLSKELFEAVAEKRDDTVSWFNLMTSAVLAGDAEKGEDAFKKSLEANEKSGRKQQPSQPMIVYYYACALNDAKMYDRSLEYLNSLKRIYMQLKITDDTFVYMRGVPYFRMTLDLAKKVFDGLGDRTKWAEWLDELEKELDEDGKRTVSEYKNG
jgi:tetratricopeptide (TPR) repeat protein